ncbi:hypothetical protein ACFQE7_39125 [Nonomuraea ferruginea]|uniref:hypothetical protein n=1 Tax=Nonomuraea ferruginea TaxID=46174 RepID=UPI00337DC58C
MTGGGSGHEGWAAGGASGQEAPREADGASGHDAGGDDGPCEPASGQAGADGGVSGQDGPGGRDVGAPPCRASGHAVGMSSRGGSGHEG